MNMKPLDQMAEDELRDFVYASSERLMVVRRDRYRAIQTEELKRPDAEPVEWMGDISSFCEDLVFHAKRLARPVRGKFNNVPVVAYPDSSPADLARGYMRGRT